MMTEADMQVAESKTPRDARGMPIAAKLAMFTAVGLLLSGAAYLIVVRGPAMIIDMAGSAMRFICF